MASPEFSSAEVSSATSSRKRIKSEVWNHYNRLEIKGPDGVVVDVRAICNSCKKELSAASKNGTGHLHRHAAKCIRPDQTNIRQTTLPQFISTTAPGPTDPKYDRVKGIIKWVVVSNLPFKSVGDGMFEIMIQNGFDPSFKMFSHQTFIKEVLKYYREEKENLISWFQNLTCKFSLACDVWTSGHGYEYLCITAHFVDDDWVMHKRIIAFTGIEDKGQLVEIINNKLQPYGIENKVCTITFDHTSHDTAAIGHLKCLLSSPFDSTFYHMRCMCHILDTTAQSGIDEIKCMTDKVKHIICSTICSQRRRSNFLFICKRHNLKCRTLPYDVKDRWNPTYKMLEAAILYKLAVIDYVSIDSHDSWTLICPTNFEWGIIENMKDLLKAFHDAIVALCGSYYPTITLAYLHIVEIVQLFNNYRHKEGLSHIVSSMEEKFNDYFSPLPALIGFGILVDPRLKDVGLSNIFTLMYEKDEQASQLATIKSYFEKLFQEYSSTSRNTSTQNLSFPRGTDTSIRKSIGISSSSRSHSLLAKVMGKTCPSSSRGVTELQQYYDAPLMNYDESQFDILEWWKGPGARFPILSTMAHDILTVPMCSVPSEVVFSTGGHKLDDYRSCLSGKTVEALICLQDWYAAEERRQGELFPPMEEFELLEI